MRNNTQNYIKNTKAQNIKQKTKYETKNIHTKNIIKHQSSN